MDKPKLGEAPNLLEQPEGLDLSEDQLTIIAPYFAHAWWYYKSYFVYVEYAVDLERLNKSQGDDIDALIKEKEDGKFVANCLWVVTGVSVITTLIAVMFN